MVPNPLETSCLSFYKLYTACLLVLINLLNYVDRFAITPLVVDISKFFGVSYGKMGVVATVFICVHMASAPVFGRLGDLYSRKLLIFSGIAMWTLSIIAGTFLPKTAFWAFVLFQGAAGLGQASFVTIPPAIIADLYIGDNRSWALMAFYMAVPFGSGLGYVLSSEIARCTNSWQWGIRTPPIIDFCVGIVFLTSFDPPRETLEHGGIKSSDNAKGDSFLTSLHRLLSIPTYLFTTLASAAVTFTLGAISFWTPTALIYVQRINDDSDIAKNKISLLLGVITATAGLLGTVFGSAVATIWRKRNRKADCLVCAYSTLTGSIFLFLAVTLARSSLLACYPNIFLAVFFLCCNWAVVPDVQLAVVDPQNRALACGLYAAVGHLLGDAASPSVLGATSDAFRGSDRTDLGYYQGFRASFYISSFVCVVGAALFFLSALCVEKDLKQQQGKSTKDGPSSMDIINYSTID